MDLDLATTSELMEELFKRETFAGIVVFSVDEHKFDTQIHNKFALMTNLSSAQTCKVLQQVQDIVIKDYHD
jgi:hypothetical protein